MPLSIIITHHKTLDLLISCLESIKRDCEALDCEIVVCDSEADGGTKSVIDKLADQLTGISIFYIPFKENVGYAKLVNGGIARSRGDFILILNADIVVSENAIPRMMEFLQNHRDVGLIGPRINNQDGSTQQTYFRFYNPWTIICRRTFFGRTILCKNTLNHFLMKDEVDHQTKRELGVDWLMGSALMTTRQAVEKVGVLDERFFMYFEDVDWAKRFWERGLKVIYFPAVAMEHMHQRYSRKYGGFSDIFLNKYARTHILSAMKYFWKWRRSGK